MTSINETKITKTMMTRMNGRFIKAEDIETTTLSPTIPTEETNMTTTISRDDIIRICNVTSYQTTKKGVTVTMYKGCAPKGKAMTRCSLDVLITQLRKQITMSDAIKTGGYKLTQGEPLHQQVEDDFEEPEFDINQRFDFVSKFVLMAARKKHHSVMITGDGGLGKSWTTIKTLEDAGYEDVTAIVAEGVDGDLIPEKSYLMVKGYSTASELFKTLYNNRKRTIVFDDCDAVLKDPVGLNILKGALDTHPGKPRFITWNSKRSANDPTPNTFAFKGSIIFISNLTEDRLDQAMRSRSMHVDVSMTNEEKVDRMETISRNKDFMPQLGAESKQKAIDFIRGNMQRIRNLNFRTLIIVAKLVSEFPGEWQDLALYQLSRKS